MQLTSGGIIFDHAYGQIMTREQLCDSVNIYSAMCYEMFHFFVTDDMMFKLHLS